MTYPYLGDHQLDPPGEPRTIDCWKCKRELFVDLLRRYKGCCHHCGEEIGPEDIEEGD